ncbi:MAG: hypothetical protein IKU86_12350 [Thermoguttaceae bacterium]|nr:hypothetical protein [Thermoguttaceae bacterium]
MSQPVEITISVPLHVADKIDQYAKIAGWSRAELLSRLVCAEVAAIPLDAYAYSVEAPTDFKKEKTK